MLEGVFACSFRIRIRRIYVLPILFIFGVHVHETRLPRLDPKVFWQSAGHFEDTTDHLKGSLCFCSKGHDLKSVHKMMRVRCMQDVYKMCEYVTACNSFNSATLWVSNS